jgi:hypothetical protein
VKAGLVAGDVALGGLLVVGVELELQVVAGVLLRLQDARAAASNFFFRSDMSPPR